LTRDFLVLATRLALLAIDQSFRVESITWCISPFRFFASVRNKVVASSYFFFLGETAAVLIHNYFAGFFSTSRNKLAGISYIPGVLVLGFTSPFISLSLLKKDQGFQSCLIVSLPVICFSSPVRNFPLST